MGQVHIVKEEEFQLVPAHIQLLLVKAVQVVVHQEVIPLHLVKLL
tara:strand:+ start:47 stop:181 length:135 start_codon:yes stop_codon:yes gene_type:complete